MILPVYKPYGLTSLQTLDKLRVEFPQYKHEKMSYAGRLDPLAQGVMLVLVGETNKKRHAYLSLPKKYTFSVIFGVATDSYDLLGIVSPNISERLPSQQQIQKTLQHYSTSVIGKQTQAYPPYSSKPVNGKSLFVWAKEGRLDEITIPTHPIEIYHFAFDGYSDITKTELRKRVKEAVGLVDGDFRQEVIQTSWDTFFNETKHNVFPVITCSIHCSSGTYIRQIAHEFGEKLSCGALALSIKRTRVGEYGEETCVKIT